jgi:hypothetical protein
VIIREAHRLLGLFQPAVLLSVDSVLDLDLDLTIIAKAIG